MFKGPLLTELLLKWVRERPAGEPAATSGTSVRLNYRRTILTASSVVSMETHPAHHAAM